MTKSEHLSLQRQPLHEEYIVLVAQTTTDTHLFIYNTSMVNVFVALVYKCIDNIYLTHDKCLNSWYGGMVCVICAVMYSA